MFERDSWNSCSFLNRFQRISQWIGRFHLLKGWRDSVMSTLDLEVLLEILSYNSVWIWWYCTSTSLCNILKLRSRELLLCSQLHRFRVYSLPIRLHTTALFNIIFLSCHVLYGHWWKRVVQRNSAWGPSRFYRACFFIRTIVVLMPAKIIIKLAASISTVPILPPS